MEGQHRSGWDRISQILQKCFQICFFSNSSTKGTEGWWLCSYRIHVPARFKHLWHRSWTVLTEADWWDQLHRHVESPGNAQKLCGCGTWGHGVAVSLAILKKVEFHDPRGLCQPKKFYGSSTLTNWPHCYPKVWVMSTFSETVIHSTNWKKFNSYTSCVGLHRAGLDSWFWFAKTAASECFSLSKPSVAAPKLAQWFWGLASHPSSSYFVQDFCRPSLRLITEHHADKLHFKNFFVNDAQVTVSNLPALDIPLPLRTGSHSLPQVEGDDNL